MQLKTLRQMEAQIIVEESEGLTELELADKNITKILDLNNKGGKSK